jgi:hypothetical protein
MKECGYCGRDNADDALRCRECGSDLNTPQSATLPRLNILARLANLSRSLSGIQKIFILSSSLFLVCLSAYIASFYLHHPRMSEEQVISIANDAAITNGFFLAEYYAPHAQFEPWKHDRTWVVTYGVKIALPWGPPLPARRSAHGAPRYFLVIVSDKKGHSIFGIPGAIIGTQKILPPPPGAKFWPIRNQTQTESNAN